MLLLIASIIAFHEPTAVRVIETPEIQASSYFASKDAAEVERRIRSSFEMTDRNSDGFIDLNEAPIAERGQQRPDGVRVAAEASNSLWIRLMDTGGDGRVNWPEMRGYLLPRYLHANGL